MGEPAKPGGGTDLMEATPPTPPTGHRRRIVAMAIWAVLFVVGLAALGVPTDPVYLFGWLWLATIAWRSDRPWRTHVRFLRDWSPVVVMIIIYNLSRGFADNGVYPHVHPLIDADRAMWGWATGGETPPVWLQRRLYDPDKVNWWDALVSLVYFSHFVTVPTAAVVLWMRNRSRWAAFMRRWITLFAAGLVSYFVYPAAPPWWAAERALIPSVMRISTRGWQAIGLHGAGNLLNAAQLDASNPVAAMPSLHTAFTVLCVGFFIPLVRARWWPLLVCYPLSMVFTLVYSGEHWVVDALIGALYAIVTLVGWSLAERWWRARQARMGAAGG
jgi:hypothetical protein